MMATRRPIPVRPTPRRGKREIPSAATAVVFCLFMVVLLVVSMWWGISHHLPKSDEKKAGAVVTHDSLCATYTYDGEVVRWYVFVDPDYGTQWVYNDHDWRAFPRIGADGTQIGVQNQSDYE